MNLFISLLESFAIYSYRDMLEVAFFCSGSFAFMHWLLKDGNQGLYRSFVIYSIFLCSAIFFQLHSLIAVALYATPAFILLTLMLHEQTLQKKLVTVKKIDPGLMHSPSSLIDDIVSSCLHARSIGKELNLFITQTDDISTLVQTEIELHTAFKHSVLKMVLESSSYQPKKIILMTSAGQLIGINGSLATVAQQDQGELNYARITATTDALFITCGPGSVGFTVYAKNSVLEKISAKQLHTFLKHQLLSFSPLKGDHCGQSFNQSQENYQQPHR